jgi:cell wall-associated NlpC family hydrolase
MPETVGHVVRDSLQQSNLVPQSQMELLQGDVDLNGFFLEMRNKAGVQLVDSITDATIERTVEGASTLTVQVQDSDLKLLNSGSLGRHVDVNVDGLWFTLVAVSKSGRQLTLTFEEREVNVLRYYKKFLRAKRTPTMTRARFVLRMIQEVKELPLRWFIPDLKTVMGISDIQPGQSIVGPDGNPLPNVFIDPVSQQIVSDSGTGAAVGHNQGGISGTQKTSLTVKGSPIDAEQINNTNAILAMGMSMKVPRKLLVVAIMVAIQENSITGDTGQYVSSPTPHKINVGTFQQDSRYWPATNDAGTDAAGFFKAAIIANIANPTLSYNDLGQKVQGSAYPYAYGPHQAEAEAIVNAYGVSGGDTTTGLPATKAATSSQDHTANVQQPPVTQYSTAAAVYEYTRGTISHNNNQGPYILTPEDSWTAMQRLAGEVNWWCFVVSGVIYFISSVNLFQGKSLMTIDEDTEGVDTIDFDYDEGKRVATVTVNCHMSRWTAPPGGIVTLGRQMGIVQGRWLVTTVRRSLYNTQGTITLKKPLPVLPEPSSNVAGQSTQQQNVLPPVSDITPGNVPYPGGGRNAPENPALPGTKAYQVIEYVKRQIGVPYVWGAEIEGKAFDCSGLTQAAYATVGVVIPHNAQAQYDLGPQVSAAQNLQPGDLVYFDEDPPGHDPTRIGHVGVYIGGGQFIHAPHTGDVVKVSSLNDTWYAEHYAGASRPGG